MKFFLIVIILFSSVNMYSQKTSLKHIPKKVTKIILSNNLTKEENMNYVIESLLDNDYIIERKDKEYGTIKTEMQPHDDINVSYFFNIRVKNNKIIITGKYILNFSISYGGVEDKPSYTIISNKGMKGSPYKKCFTSMYEFSNKLEFSKIEFE